MIRPGPVVAAAGVVLARPDHLHRRPDGPGNLHGLAHEVVVRHRPPAEAAAQQRRVQRHLFRFQAGLRRRGVAVARLELRAHPHLAAVGPHVGDAVDRLHRCVSQIRQVVHGLERLGRLRQRVGRVAVLACGHPGLLRQFGVLLELGAAVEAGERPVVPDHLECLAPLLGGPEAVGDDGHAARDLHHVPHTGHGPGLVGIEALDLAAEDRRTRNQSDQHSRELHVQAEDGLTVDFVRRVEPPGRLADEAEILGVLQLDVLWRLEVGGLLRQLAVRHTPARGGMDHVAGFRAARRRLDVPFRSRGGDQHGPRGRPGLAHAIPLGPGAGAAAGHLNAVHRVVVDRRNRGRLESDLRPVGVELLGDEHRDAGVRALAHLRVVDDDGHGVVGPDPHKGIERERPPLLTRRLARRERGQVQAQHQPTARE